MGGNARHPDGRFFVKGQSYELSQAEVAALQPALNQEQQLSPPLNHVSTRRLGDPQWRWYDAEIFRKGKKISVPAIDNTPQSRQIPIDSPEGREIRDRLEPPHVRRGIHRQQVRLMAEQAGDEVAIKHLQSLPKPERVALLRFLPEFKQHFLEDFPND